jgi:WD40 repeat protein
VRRYAKGRPPEVLVGHRAQVTAVAVSPDDRFAFSASKDGTIVVWDLAAGEAIDRVDLGPSDDQPLALAISPDGKTLAVATARGLVLLYWFKP